MKKDRIISDILKKVFDSSGKIGKHELLSATFECGAIAISNQFDYVQRDRREKQYLSVISRYDKETQGAIAEIFGDIYSLLIQMTDSNIGFGDYLGEIYMQSDTSNSKAGQFFTPYSVSKLNAEMLLDEKMVRDYMENDRILTIGEPACGSGGMILASADVLFNRYGFNTARNLLVECGDLDKRCVHMTYLQLSLAGIPAIIYQRDTLTMKTYDKWYTPAYLMQYLRFRSLMR